MSYSLKGFKPRKAKYGFRYVSERNKMTTYTRLVDFLSEYHEGVDYFLQSKELSYPSVEFTIYVNNDNLYVALKLSST